MANKPIQLNESEALLIGQLRERPELYARMQEVLEIVQTQPGELRKADEVENLLVEVIRTMGREAMESWALSAEQEAGDQAKRQDQNLHVSKKKP